jgi:FlaA1/EpsC-like NDP-sugar epimerase
MDTSLFAGKTLLITGGTGTFGNAVVDMACKTGFGEIRIFSRDEKKRDDMRGRIRNAAVKFYLGDVRSYDSVLQAMRGVALSSMPRLLSKCRRTSSSPLRQCKPIRWELKTS